MTKGQFYMISLTFAAISVLLLLLFILFTEFGPLASAAANEDFENLENAVKQRNDWIDNYWFNLNWSTRTIVNITAITTNPVNITAATSGDCYNTTRVFNRTANGSFNEVPSNVSSISATCGSIFNATVGVYEIYWNATPVPSVAPAGRDLYGASEGTAPTFTSTVEQVPSEGLCAHFANTTARKNILLQCNGTARETFFNYSVNFTTTDFQFRGVIT